MLAVTQNGSADITDAQTVYQQTACRHGIAQTSRIFADLDRTADLTDENVLRVDTHLACQTGMLHEHAVLAVYGNEVLRLAQTEHQLKILLAGMAGNMDGCRTVVNDLSALLVQLVDHVVDRLLVAWDSRRCDQDTIAGIDLHLLVAAVRHTVQRGHGLTLRASGYDDQLAARVALDLGNVDHDLAGILQITQLHRNLGDLLHASAADGYLASCLGGNVENLLQTRYIGRERCNDDALVALHDKFLERFADDFLTRRVARTLDVGRVAHQRKQSLLAQLTDADKVDHLTGNRRQVDLEVTRVQDGAQRRGDRQRNRIRNGVVGVDKLDLEAAELNRITGAHAVHLDLLGHLVLGQLGFDDAAGQSGRVDRCVALTQNIRNSADMVLMSVGDHIAAQLVQVALEVRCIRNDQVNTQHIVIRKGNAAVDNYDVIAVLDHRHVLTDLVQAAERYDLQFFLHNSIITFLYLIVVYYMYADVVSAFLKRQTMRSRLSLSTCEGCGPFSLQMAQRIPTRTANTYF